MNKLFQLLALTSLAIVAINGHPSISKHESLKSLEHRETVGGVTFQDTRFNCYETGTHCLSVEGDQSSADFEKYDFSTLDGSKGICNYQFEHPTKGKAAGYETFSGICSSNGKADWLIQCVNDAKAYVHVQFPAVINKKSQAKFYAHNGALATFTADASGKTKFEKNGASADASAQIVVKCPK